ncbi:hypothetical protein [uncultured Algibacter sp.]|nr:hypothetical protein [uncultured Algibacter sp.]
MFEIIVKESSFLLEEKMNAQSQLQDAFYFENGKEAGVFYSSDFK